MKKSITQLTKSEFNTLKKSGMLWEIYPEAFDTYERYIKCKCGKIAVWCYMPGEKDCFCCDDCVPRGCSCNIELKDELVTDDLTQEQYEELYKDKNNLVEQRDDKNRKRPCCEWWYDEEGFEK